MRNYRSILPARAGRSNSSLLSNELSPLFTTTPASMNHAKTLPLIVIERRR